MKLCKTKERPGAALALGVALFLAACAGSRDEPMTTHASIEDASDGKIAGATEAREADSTLQAETRAQPQSISGAASGTEEIIVSSRRKVGSLQDVPMGIAAGRMEMDSTYHAPALVRVPVEPLDRENYEHLAQNPVRLVSENPVSTFSIDVDTGAYSNVRRFLNGGSLPPQDAVRTEELINYFAYDYPVPRTGDVPFLVSTGATAAPWNEDKLLLRVGIKGFEVPAHERPAANLVFLIDVSGSMNSPAKLPLLKNALKMLTRQMTKADRVSMVVYAGSSGVALEPTPGDEQAKILGALGRLQAGGGTNGASGIRLAYQMAEQAFIAGGINRVMLATDGDFNVGTVNFEALVDIAERNREKGISLTTLGFGAGNYNDHLMEQLADAGNGNHAYIDTLNEGRKVLVEQLTGTLQTIARDVKIQIEFNPSAVAEYRLIGYENRMLRREDFNNDKIDAGEIGAGHTVTALYELAMVDSNARLIDPLRYGQTRKATRGGADEFAFVRVRFKAPDGGESRLIEQAVSVRDIDTLDEADTELKFSAAVAAFGQLLKGGEYIGDFDYVDVAELAAGARGADPFGYRGEFLGLVRLADTLDSERQVRR